MVYSASSRVFHDPGQLGAGMPHCHISMLPEAHGAFCAKLTTARLSDIHLSMTEETLPRRAVLSFRPDRLFVRFVALGDRPKIRNGREDVPGTLSIGPAEADVGDLTTGPSVSRSLSVPIATALARAELLLDGQRLLEGRATTMRSLAPALLARLVHLHQAVIDLVPEWPSDTTPAPRLAAMNTNLWDLLAEIIASLEEENPATSDRHHGALRRAAEFIEANADRPVALWELCGVARCSGKTLERLFLRKVGETPNRYMRRVRLWRARDALRKATSAEATVSEIAVACGFWELGRFAVAYRSLFGESPSTTLNAQPGAN